MLSSVLPAIDDELFTQLITTAYKTPQIEQNSMAN